MTNETKGNQSDVEITVSEFIISYKFHDFLKYSDIFTWVDSSRNILSLPRLNQNQILPQFQWHHNCNLIYNQKFLLV